MLFLQLQQTQQQQPPYIATTTTTVFVEQIWSISFAIGFKRRTSKFKQASKQQHIVMNNLSCCAKPVVGARIAKRDCHLLLASWVATVVESIKSNHINNTNRSVNFHQQKAVNPCTTVSNINISPLRTLEFHVNNSVCVCICICIHGLLFFWLVSLLVFISHCNHRYH